jgi:peptide/nickel transport system permease protein
MTLSLVAFAGIMPLTWASMLETLREDYILTARAKGLLPGDPRSSLRLQRAVTGGHVLVLALAFGRWWCHHRDRSLVARHQAAAAQLDHQRGSPCGHQGAVCDRGVALCGHLVADLVYMYPDPRIRYQ